MRTDTDSVPAKLLICESEAAKLLGISPRSLFSLRKSGQIPCVRLGGRVLYSPAALQAVIEARTSTVPLVCKITQKGGRPCALAAQEAAQ